jgi:predicted PurR-regulated permease PerM
MRVTILRNTMPAFGPQTNVLETAAVVFIVVVVVTTLYLGGEILQPLALAGLLSFILAPVIRTLVRVGLSKTLSVLASVIVAVGMFVVLSLTMAQQIANLAAELPGYEANLREKIRTIKTYSVTSGALERASKTLKELQSELDANKQNTTASAPLPAPSPAPLPVEVRAPQPAVLEYYSSLVAPLLKPIAQTGLVILFLLFILLQREDLRDRVLKLGGVRDLQRSTVAMTDAANSLSRFFLLQLTLNAGFGIIIALGLAVIGVPNPLVWGVLAALMRFVPFIGSFIAAAFPILLAAAVDPGWSMVLATAALFLVLEPLAGHIVEPLVYGKNTGLSPLAIVLATIFWTLIWGPIGLLLATPLTLCLVVLGNHLPGLSMLTMLLGDQPALKPSERLYQRLLVGDVAEAESLAEDEIEESNLLKFYQDVALQALLLAKVDATDGNVPSEYLARLSGTVEELTEDLDDHDLTDTDERKAASDQVITCLGACGWVDEASAHILSHALRKAGFKAQMLGGGVSADGNRLLVIDSESEDDERSVFFVAAFGAQGVTPHMRYVVRRLRRQVPDATIFACCWEVQDDSRVKDLTSVGLDGVARTLHEAISLARDITEKAKPKVLEATGQPSASAG